MGGFSLSSDEASLLCQGQERLRREIDNLVKDCSEENEILNGRRCDYSSTATNLQTTIRVPENALFSTAQSPHPTMLKQAFRLLRYSIFLSTNELLPLSQTDKVLQWALGGGHFWVIESVLKQRTPTTDSFATKLLISSIGLGEKSIYQSLLKNGANPNGIFPGENTTSVLPIYKAIDKVDALAVRLLLEHGANTSSWFEGLPSALDKCTRNFWTGNSYTEIIRLLIEHGADVNEEDIDSFYEDSDDLDKTMLHKVIASGNTEVARLFLEAGAHVDIEGVASPLQLSALVGRTELVKLLLEFNADVNAPICDYEKHVSSTEFLDHRKQHRFLTPLQIAIANDQYNVVEILLGHGADVNGFRALVSGDEDEDKYDLCLRGLYGENIWSPTYDYHEIFDSGYHDDDVTVSACIDVSKINFRDLRLASSPLQAAAASGNIALVYRLLDMGADIHAIGGFGTALQVASARKGNIQIVELLLSEGAYINAPASRPIGRTALQAAIEIGDMDIVGTLLDAGANVNAEPSGKYGCTAVQAAIESNNVPLAAWLFQRQANSHTAESFIPQSLKNIENTSMVDLLLQNYCDLNGRIMIRYGERIACEAAAYGQNTEDLRMLLKYGFDADYLGNFLGGRNLLCTSDSLEALQILLEYGMSPNKRIGLFTPAAMAIEERSSKSLQLLISAGVDINSTVSGSSIHGQTLIEMAAAIGSMQLCEILIEANADLGGNRGTAALVAAVKGQHTEVIKHLLSLGVSPNWEDVSGPKEMIFSTLPSPTGAILSAIKDAWPRSLWNASEVLELLLNHSATVQRNVTDLEKFGQLPANLLYRLFQQGLGADSHTALIRNMFLLKVSARRGHLDIVTQLLIKNPDVFFDSKARGVALQKAVEGQHQDIVELLLSTGADINYPAGEVRGATALQWAALVGSMPIFTLLLERGADVHAAAARFNGRTALEAAAEHGRLGMVYMLLVRDREPATLGLRCGDAAKRAESRGFFACARALREWGVSKAPGEEIGVSDGAMDVMESDCVAPSTPL